MFNFLRPSAPAARLTVNDAADRLSRGDLVLIDVRETGEVRASGMAKGAINIPVALLSMRADPRHPDHDKRLDPSKAVALYCASGARSGMATQLLQRLGYGEVYNLGGLGDWVNGGGAVSR